MIKTEQRKFCAVTGRSDLEDLYTYNSKPAYIGCVDTQSADDIIVEQRWVISRSTGIIQLENLLPLDIVYAGFHSEGVGDLWEEHYQRYSDFIARTNAASQVLEIGGGNGRLGMVYLGKKSEVQWTIIEPTPPSVTPPNVNYRAGFIEDNLDIVENASCIVSSHVFEHLYHPRRILETLTGSMETGCMIYFSIPALNKYIEDGAVNAVNFEHTFLVSEGILISICNEFGFKLCQVEEFGRHSIFLSFKYTGDKILSYDDKYEYYKKLFLDNISSLKTEVSVLNNKMKEHVGAIYIFGAHVFTQELIAAGLNVELLRSILDNSDFKIGKRLYGTDLIVESPSIIANQSSPIVILRVGNYEAEIRKQLTNLNSRVEII